MNFLHPELLLLSGHVAVLVLLTSLLAGAIGWFWRGLRGAAAELQPAELVPQPESAVPAQTLEDQAAAKAMTEELKRELATTEGQCIEALEQRDEAERQAALRAKELHEMKAELAQLRDTTQHARETALADSEAQVSKLKQQLNEARITLETKERERAEAKHGAEQLRQQMDKLQRASDGAVAEAADLKQQLATARSLVSIGQGKLEQLAKEKAEVEIALKTQIDHLLAAKTNEPAVRPVQMPRPALPSEEAMAAGAGESFTGFPLAPAAPPRKKAGESLFDESSMASLSSQVPSLEDAQAALRELQQDLEQKEIEVLAQTQERDQGVAELEVARGMEPKVKAKVTAAEKRLRTAQTRLDEAIAGRDSGQRQVRAIARALALVAEPGSQADDLTRLKGVKAVINSQLHAFGIFTYRQIVHWDAEDIAAFSELLAFKNRIHRDQWQEQARALHEAKYGERLMR